MKVVDLKNPSRPRRVATLQNPEGTSSDDVAVIAARKPLAGVGLSGQMHGLVALDATPGTDADGFAVRDGSGLSRHNYTTPRTLVKVLDACIIERYWVFFAATTNGKAGSVKFIYDGQEIRTENHLPYALAADDDGDFNSWSPKCGTHTLCATPYKNDDAAGSDGRRGGDGGAEARGRLTTAASPSAASSPRPCSYAASAGSGTERRCWSGYA